MTGASEDLLQAVYGLRKAAEGQFTGNAYYQVANEINELIELLGWGSGEAAAGPGRRLWLRDHARRGPQVCENEHLGQPVFRDHV